MYNEAKTYAEEAYSLGKDEVTEKLLDDIDSVLNLQEEKIIKIEEQ
jgi:hypothetical protein